MGTHSFLLYMDYQKHGCDENVWKPTAVKYVNGIGYRIFPAERKAFDHLGYTTLDAFTDNKKGPSVVKVPGVHTFPTEILAGCKIILGTSTGGGPH